MRHRIARRFASRPLAAALVALTTLGTAAASAPLSAALQDEPESAEDEFAALESQDLRAGGDEHQRYFLSRFKQGDAPKPGYKLLLVLPGGDGGADFHGFVQRIHLNALSDEYLVAQLVAPRWTEQQAEELVWPTERNPWPKMAFSTEEFVNAVIADVEARFPLDLEHVFTLAWSSGGPAAYAYSVYEETRVTGTFVAMSIFRPEQMESLKSAKGQAYYLLHSPEDFIAMSHPEQAQKDLSKNKAAVELATYEGGHGWHGDVYGNLRRGVRFLEKNHAPAKEGPEPPKKAKKSKSNG